METITGWKTVPVESTSPMDNAGLAALPDGCMYVDAERCYLAMIAAAPVPPAPQAVDDAIGANCELGGGCMCASESGGVSESCKYFSAAPVPVLADLTDEQIEFIASHMGTSARRKHVRMHEFARAILAAARSQS